MSAAARMQEPTAVQLGLISRTGNKAMSNELASVPEAVTLSQSKTTAPLVLVERRGSTNRRK
jgi:hypothetical protein